MDNSELRPRTREELAAIIAEILDAPMNYQTAADAMWQCALAAFNLAAHEQNVAGWQASWAEMKFLIEARRIESPVALISADDLMYPQNVSRTTQLLDDWSEYMADKAREHLATSSSYAHPEVVEHWKWLASKHQAKIEE